MHRHAYHHTEMSGVPAMVELLETRKLPSAAASPMAQPGSSAGTQPGSKQAPQVTPTANQTSNAQTTHPTDTTTTGPVIPPPAISPVTAVSPSGGFTTPAGTGTINSVTPAESSTLNEATFNPVAFALYGEFAFNAGLVYDPFRPWLSIEASRDELLL